MVGAILIHDRQAFDAARGWPGFGDIHQAGVEITALSGQALINHIRNNMGQTPPIAGYGGHRLTFQLRFGVNIPEAELDAQAPIGCHRHTAVDQGLSVDHPPIAEPRQHIHRQLALNESGLVDRPKQARAL